MAHKAGTQRTELEAEVVRPPEQFHCLLQKQDRKYLRDLATAPNTLPPWLTAPVTLSDGLKGPY